MARVCQESAKSRSKTQVLFHLAYWIPAAQTLSDFAKMVDGTWDCHQVEVKIVTNSIETTDLNIINVYARYVMQGFFDFYRDTLAANAQSRFSKSARFSFFETKAQIQSPVSLHAKVVVFGHDLWIGSANGDVRSYYMDTNNGMHLFQVPTLAQGYFDQVFSLGTEALTDLTPYFLSLNATPFHLAQDQQMLDVFLNKYAFTRQWSPERRKMLMGLQTQLAQKIYLYTKQVLSIRYIDSFYIGEDYSEEEGKKQQMQEDIRFKYNRLLQLL